MPPVLAESEKQPAGQPAKQWRPETLRRYPGLVRRAERGSRAAVIALTCRECMGYDLREILRCTAPPCPSFDFRPNGSWRHRPKSTADHSANLAARLHGGAGDRAENAPGAPATDIGASAPANAVSGGEQADHSACATRQPVGGVRR